MRLSKSLSFILAGVVALFAFGGALLIIKPSFQFTHVIPAAAGFIGGAGAGLAYACVRKLHAYKVNGSLIIVFFSAFSCLFAIPFLVNHFAQKS